MNVFFEKQLRFWMENNKSLNFFQIRTFSPKQNERKTAKIDYNPSVKSLNCVYDMYANNYVKTTFRWHSTTGLKLWARKIKVYNLTRCTKKKQIFARTITRRQTHATVFILWFRQRNTRFFCWKAMSLNYVEHQMCLQNIFRLDSIFPCPALNWKSFICTHAAVTGDILKLT